MFAADGQTLTWPPLPGAELYNAYRGNLSDLVDSDGDGSPDGGYGDCVSHLDVDTSDTSFVDGETPPPGSGLFYLFSLVDTRGQERGLGTTSAGRPRAAATPCPSVAR